MNSENSLLTDQLRIVPEAAVILDVGAQHGHTTKEYLEHYPCARVFAFEPDRTNWTKASDLLTPFGSRVVLLDEAMSDNVTTENFYINSHDGTHSLLEIGDQHYWGGPAAAVATVQVCATTLDAFADLHAIETIDILKMDIQGGELRALRGARQLLAQRRIRLIATEVEFQYLYRDQPLIWEIGAFLQQFGFGFYRLYDCQYHSKNSNVLSWADAIFLGPEFLHVPSWR